MSSAISLAMRDVPSPFRLKRGHRDERSHIVASHFENSATCDPSLRSEAKGYEHHQCLPSLLASVRAQLETKASQIMPRQL